jgi:hypothetical protein
MKETIAKKWVQALRSGRYKQGKDLLKKITKKQERHCCLGVLCDLYNKEQKLKNKPPIKQKIERDISNRYDVVRFGTTAELLPTTVRRWAGVKTSDGMILFEDYIRRDSLSSLNDQGVTFKSIANLIEKHFKNL